MYAYIAAFLMVAIPLYFNRRRQQQGNQDDGKDKEIAEYEKQKVKFIDTGKPYIEQIHQELTEDRPHFDTLRKIASSDVKDIDYLGITLGEEKWLFPVSQKHLQKLYSINGIGGKMETIPFSQAVGYAPDGMPFIHTNEHWKELRKTVAAIFHSDFMEAYMGHFNTAVKELVTSWKATDGNAVDIVKDI